MTPVRRGEAPCDSADSHSCDLRCNMCTGSRRNRFFLTLISDWATSKGIAAMRDMVSGYRVTLVMPPAAFQGARSVRIQSR